MKKKTYLAIFNIILVVVVMVGLHGRMSEARESAHWSFWWGDAYVHTECPNDVCTKYDSRVLGGRVDLTCKHGTYNSGECYAYAHAWSGPYKRGGISSRSQHGGHAKGVYNCDEDTIYCEASCISPDTLMLTIVGHLKTIQEDFALFELVIYTPNAPFDTIIEDPLYSGKAILQGGTLVTSGFLSLSDFDVWSFPDEDTGFTIASINAQKYFQISCNEDDSITVYLAGDCGQQAGPSIPALTDWGLIIFGVVLLGFITWVFLKRRKVIGVRV